MEEKVSARMLYEMARRYDRWAGEDYDGSSCRGAIKGWKNSGVCLESLSPYKSNDTSFSITPEISADARLRTIGAYYRLRPVVSDVHAALNETGVVYASARVHEGWFKPVNDSDGEAIITQHTQLQGGHAFAIVGYNTKGFWVQNSWGESWGDLGLALWLYEDWAANIMDAWVVQLALPTPQIFDSGLNAGQASSANRQVEASSPPRVSIEEHFVHLDDGKYHDSGRYWSNASHMEVVQHGIREKKPSHLLLYAHGGLNSIKASAKRISSMKQVFLENGIYPFHFMYDTGLMEELKDIIFHKRENANQRSGGIRDWFDRRIENLTRKPGRALWREMKYGAESPFSEKSDDGSDVLMRLLDTTKANSIKLHVAGHSTGAILQAYLLHQLQKLDKTARVQSCSLMAPAATNGLFKKIYLPLLDSKVVQEMTIYNLTEELEQDDNVAKVYGKSLLYLVSRAFEENPVAPILGMQKYNSVLPVKNLPVKFVYSKGGKRGRSLSTSHGGFDNDPATLNDILKRILGTKPKRPFRESDLDY